MTNIFDDLIRVSLGVYTYAIVEHDAAVDLLCRLANRDIIIENLREHRDSLSNYVSELSRLIGESEQDLTAVKAELLTADNRIDELRIELDMAYRDAAEREKSLLYTIDQMRDWKMTMLDGLPDNADGEQVI